MQLHNEEETNQDKVGLFFFTPACRWHCSRGICAVRVWDRSCSYSSVRSSPVVLSVVKCLPKKRWGKHNDYKEKKNTHTLFFCLAVCRAEQRFLDGEQNCAPVFWHRSVTRADRETESVGAGGATFIWCEKHCWSDTFIGNFLTLCCHLK